MMMLACIELRSQWRREGGIGDEMMKKRVLDEKWM
jgi:hypothetical protein